MVNKPLITGATAISWQKPWRSEAKVRSYKELPQVPDDVVGKIRFRYCWWKKSCTTWHVYILVNNGINYVSTYQLLQDFFHQQYSVVLVTALLIRISYPFGQTVSIPSLQTGSGRRTREEMCVSHVEIVHCLLYLLPCAMARDFDVCLMCYGVISINLHVFLTWLSHTYHFSILQQFNQTYASMIV